jgi:hypothetical protein
VLQAPAEHAERRTGLLQPCGQRGADLLGADPAFQPARCEGRPLPRFPYEHGEVRRRVGEGEQERFGVCVGGCVGGGVGIALRCGFSEKMGGVPYGCFYGVEG